MTRRPLPMLVLLALIWGSSFMFIKVAVRELSPATLILGRIGLAALVLVVVVPALVGVSETVAEVRAHWHWLVVVGLLNTAVPFWLLSWGETRIDSGLASIIQASVPIFNALLAYGFFREQRVTGGRLVGVVFTPTNSVASARAGLDETKSRSTASTASRKQRMNPPVADDSTKAWPGRPRDRTWSTVPASG